MAFKKGTKKIALDAITCKFLAALRSERLHMGLTLKETAGYIGCTFSNIGEFERGEAYPALETLMRLSELYDYDLSGSVNYRYYHGKIYSCNIKKLMKRYKLTLKELTSLTGFGRMSVFRAVHLGREVSLECLDAVLGVLKRENELYHFRKCLLSGRKKNAHKLPGAKATSNRINRADNHVSSAGLQHFAWRSRTAELA